MNKKNRLLLLLCLLAVTGVQAQRSLKILQYNVLKGFQGDTALMKKYIDWIKTVQPDIIIYQELNTFTQQSLSGFAAYYGHPYAVIAKETGYPVGITSRYPIVNVQKVTDNMWHGYIYAHIAGIHVFAVHLAPFDNNKRKEEIAAVLAHAALLPANEGILIAGDCNAIARSDEAAYRQEIRQVAQYNDTITDSTLRKKPRKLTFAVTDTLVRSGFTDTYHSLHPAFKSSIPTLKYSMGKFPSRLDYIWVNTPLAGKLLSADIIHNALTDVLSDHYPNLVEIAP